MRGALPVDTVELARALLGALLVRESPHGRTVGRIVETEAYPPGDPSSHAFRGRTQRNGAMFAARGIAYVYLSYGMHFCLNVASERAGTGAAVLLRALEPLEGMALMQQRRGLEGDAVARGLASGPARLTQAFEVDRAFDGADLTRPGRLWLARGEEPAGVGVSRRIGLTRAVELPLRFYVSGSPYLSGPRRLSP